MTIKMRNPMTKLPLLTLLFSATLTTQVQAMEKLTLVLDWYIILSDTVT